MYNIAHIIQEICNNIKKLADDENDATSFEFINGVFITSFLKKIEYLF